MQKTGFARNTPARPAAPVEGLAARQAAAALISAVTDKHLGLDALLDSDTAPPQWRGLDPRDRALAVAITKVALRRRGTIAACLATLIERPLPESARATTAILHAAAAQILFLRVPASAAVNLAVNAANGDLQAKRHAGLVNAVLRRLATGGEALLAQAEATAIDAPDWLFAALAADYGDGEARAMLAAQRAESPLDITVIGDAAGWAERLGGIVLETGTVRLPHGQTPIPELPGFNEGAWWVQDAAAALPARLLGDIAGLRVADICAAPGGKTAQLAHAGAKVTALDISKPRLARVTENLARLGLHAEIAAGDARKHVPPEPYDAVLLDAPCSSTGTLRRHPDVAWTKAPEDVANLTRIQRELLDAALRMLKPGGLLVYANCSLLKAEGERLVEGWLAGRGDVAVEPVTAARDGAALARFADAAGALRTTPLDMAGDDPALAGMDGFYAVRLRKSAAA